MDFAKFLGTPFLTEHLSGGCICIALRGNLNLIVVKGIKTYEMTTKLSIGITYFESYSQGRSKFPGVFFKKGFLKNFAKFTGKHLRLSLFFNKDVGLKFATF